METSVLRRHIELDEKYQKLSQKTDFGLIRLRRTSIKAAVRFKPTA